MLQCFNASTSQYFNASMLQQVNASNTSMLPCFNTSKLQCSNASLFQHIVDDLAALFFTASALQSFQGFQPTTL
jgi:hypothetical protein